VTDAIEDATGTLADTRWTEDGEDEAAAAVEAFREYDVRYVWVGPAERERYDGRGMIDFASIDGVEMVEEASTPSVTVFRVTGSELPSASSLRDGEN